MKRILILCLTLLLAMGCAPNAAPEGTPSPAPTVAPTPTPIPTPSPSPTPEPISVILYVPDENGKALNRQEGVILEDSPMGLINGLVEAGVLPDVDYGKNLYFCCEASQVRARTPKKKYRSLELMTIRMDISDAFAVALRKTNRQKERVIMQCFANTFLDYYGAEAFRLTVYGADVEACGDFYDYALLKDTMAKTIEKEE